MAFVYRIVNYKHKSAYIGSTCKTPDYRWMVHRKDLKAGLHHSRFLQRAWEKYGKEFFIFEVLEESDASTILAREQLHLDAHKNSGWRVYNVCQTAGNCLGTKRTKAQKKRISEAHLGLRVSKSTNRKHAKTWCEKYGVIRHFQSPSGRKYMNVTNTRDFARRHKLCPVSLGLLAKGVMHRHKGWTMVGSQKRIYSLIDPSGIKYKRITQLKSFCKKMKLPYKQIHKLFSGERISVGGWVKL